MANRLLVEFDFLRPKAESEKQMGGAFPEAFPPVVCMRRAALLRSEKSVALASSPGGQGFPDVAKQMRRRLGTCGGADRHDILVAADMDASSTSKYALRTVMRKRNVGEKEGGRRRGGKWK